MRIPWWFYTIPLISAFIHWLTIWMALKLLFHPRRPRKVLGFTLQGVFPKKQKQIAESLGRIVGQELLSFGDIEENTSPIPKMSGASFRWWKGISIIFSITNLRKPCP